MKFLPGEFEGEKYHKCLIIGMVHITPKSSDAC